MSELIFEKSRPNHRGHYFPPLDIPEKNISDLIPEKQLRKNLAKLPELAESEVVRHYTRLSQDNYCIDTHFYPLGSCTMKYNPKINEDLARLTGFSQLHPLTEAQGALRLMYELESCLKEILGFDAFTLQPAAGAHGELTALMIMKSYFKSQNELRDTILIPQTAHGTNPASAAFCGYKIIEIPSDKDGNIDLESLKNNLNKNIAGVMITNPNTLGLFERDILKIAELTHQSGALLYGDGANSNALLGRTRPGDLGFDIMHVNLHKTFSTPHGGGGPGSGPVGVKKEFEPYLPIPLILKNNDKYILEYNRPKSIGRIRAFYGNFSIFIRAYAYIRANGAEGLKNVTDQAVLSANYMKEKLKNYWELPYARVCMHEFVLSGDKLAQETGVKTLDIAKRLLDYGYYAPTIYFPLTVKESLMIEPTETEPKVILDKFIESMIKIYQEAYDTPELIKNAPSHTPVGRFDEVSAARNPNLKYHIK